MRKNICIMLVLLLCLGLLTGCDTNYEYATHLTSTSSSMDAELPVTPIWTLETTEAPQECTVEFQGKAYTGAYCSSHNRRLSSFGLHQYWGDGFNFDVNAKTGELVAFSFFIPGFSEKEVYKQDVSNPEKTAIEIAEQTASEYIDPSEYERSVSSQIRTVDIGGETLKYTKYSIIYSKDVCGLNTADMVQVNVNSKGTLETVILGEIGAFDHIGQNDISLEKVEARIAEKLEEIEQKSETFSSEDYEITEHSIHLTPQKEVAVVSYVNVWWERAEGDTTRYLLELTTLLK